MSRLTRASVLAGCVLCLVFAWASVRSYRALDADALENAAIIKMKAALEVLNDGDIDPAERLVSYERELIVARSLLQQSLRANPAQPTALARLAAVRWEIGPQESSRNEIVTMIGIASSMADHVPEVQSELGTLLLRMGRVEDALRYLSRAVTLDPRVAVAIVGAMDDAGLEPERIAMALPAEPQVLVALRRPYSASGLSDQYIAMFERTLSSAPEPVVRAYVEASIEARQAMRAVDAIGRLVPSGDIDLDAARLVGASRASRAAGLGKAAVSLSERARTLLPQSPLVLQELGRAYLAEGDAAAAVVSFREAVAVAAASSTARDLRPALYTDLGRAEEGAGRPDRAYDEYRRALEIDPDASYPRARIDAMRGSAGTRDP